MQAVATIEIDEFSPDDFAGLEQAIEADAFASWAALRGVDIEGINLDRLQRMIRTFAQGRVDRAHQPTAGML